MAGKTKDRYEVLLVDDDEGDVVLAQLALSESGYPCHVSVACNGDDALAFLRKLPPYGAAPTPDLVLLDLNMPKKSGKEVLAELQREPTLRAVPVVVLSTSVGDRDVLDCYRLGASGYVAKPMDMEDLIASIRGIETYWFSVVRRPA